MRKVWRVLYPYGLSGIPKGDIEAVTGRHYSQRFHNE